MMKQRILLRLFDGVKQKIILKVNKMINTKTLSIILIPLLLLCLLPMPYWYYQLVRVVSTFIFAYIAYQERGNQMMWIFIGLAILFQPIEKIALGRTLWNIIDFLVALFLVWHCYLKRE
jgi:hypothetical protein